MKRSRLDSESRALTVWCWSVIPALAESPKGYVKGILDQVMAIQTDPALAGEAHEAQRGRQIHQIIERSFDFPFMAKDALGAASGHLEPGIRHHLQLPFSGLLYPHGRQVSQEREHYLQPGEAGGQQGPGGHHHCPAQ